jgi:hypothetical protein
VKIDKTHMMEQVLSELCLSDGLSLSFFQVLSENTDLKLSDNFMKDKISSYILKSQISPHTSLNTQFTDTLSLLRQVLNIPQGDE